jgi:hypothetical protein
MDSPAIPVRIRLTSLPTPHGCGLALGDLERDVAPVNPGECEPACVPESVIYMTIG